MKKTLKLLARKPLNSSQSIFNFKLILYLFVFLLVSRQELCKLVVIKVFLGVKVAPSLPASLLASVYIRTCKQRSMEIIERPAITLRPTFQHFFHLRDLRALESQLNWRFTILKQQVGLWILMIRSNLNGLLVTTSHFLGKPKYWDHVRGPGGSLVFWKNWLHKILLMKPELWWIARNAAW